MWALAASLDVAPAGACDVVQPMRTVSVHVSPWADIVVDGELVARGVMRVDLALAVGPHVIELHNAAAVDASRIVLVPADGPAPTLDVTLARKPAGVRVNSNVDDAAVSVCGPPARAAETRAQPILVHVPASDAVVEVRVSRPGYSTVLRRVELQPGRAVTVDVALAPER